jgi:casein kinase I family protein HRR25
MRSLGIDHTPSYDRWREMFADLSELSLPFDFGVNKTGKPPLSTGRTVGSSPIMFTIVAPHTSHLSKFLASKPPLSIFEPGQLIYAQLLPRMTIEGYTISRADPYWLDPSLSDEKWPTVPRPAVVLQVSKNWRGKSVLEVAPITRCQLGAPATKILLTSDEQARGSDAATVSGTGWPQDSTWCYVFLRTNTFICNPDQVRLSDTSMGFISSRRSVDRNCAGTLANC